MRLAFDINSDARTIVHYRPYGPGALVIWWSWDMCPQCGGICTTPFLICVN